jgi:hypothetical protein
VFTELPEMPILGSPVSGVLHSRKFGGIKKSRGFDPASAPEHQAVTIKGYTLCIATYKDGA